MFWVLKGLNIIYLDTLRKQTHDVILKGKLVEMLQESGSLEYTRQRMGQLIEQMQQEIRQWPENTQFTEYLNRMLAEMNFVIV